MGEPDCASHNVGRCNECATRRKAAEKDQLLIELCRQAKTAKKQLT